MAKITKALRLGVLAAFVLFLFSCNSVVKQSESSTLLLLIDLTAQDMDGNDANFLQSDVVYQDQETSTIYADIGQATLRAQLMDPSTGVLDSVYNDIELTKYTVKYARSDGKNTEGVDIPYSFDGALSAYIQVGSDVGVSFVLVREVAKLEPPLINLSEGRSEGVLQMTARIDFYGHDLIGNNVQATGYITIFFANYANE
jgi:hypothetical protein